MIRLVKILFPYRTLFAFLIIGTIADFVILVVSNISALDAVQTSVSNLDFTDFVYRNTGVDDRIVDSTIVLVNFSRLDREGIGRLINNINHLDHQPICSYQCTYHLIDPDLFFS